uniref:Uncharacterized protein n=1 Tax=Strigamia maritima TaxID=126957 RepID=T1IXN0_STRMM
MENVGRIAETSVYRRSETTPHAAHGGSPGLQVSAEKEAKNAEKDGYPYSLPYLPASGLDSMCSVSQNFIPNSYSSFAAGFESNETAARMSAAAAAYGSPLPASIYSSAAGSGLALSPHYHQGLSAAFMPGSSYSYPGFHDFTRRLPVLY